MTNLLKTKEAARFLGVSEAFLERDRCYGAEIPFVRIGKRGVRYELAVLQEYARGRIRKSTSDVGTGKTRGRG